MALVVGGKGVRAQVNAKNIAINGDMTISQRSTSVASITSSGYYTVDRYKFSDNSDATITMSQESLTSGNAYTDGFANALKVDVTTADSSLASGQYALISQAIEGQDLQLLKKGTANAETLTVAFWVKATKTGTSIFEIFDNDNTRQVSKAFTISSSDTWEKKVLNFPADTTGALDDDNAVSLYFQWYLCAGSDYTSGTLSETWTGNTGANRVVGQVNHFDSASNNFHITGFQIEVGTFSSTTLPPFQHESYGDNLMRCYRYFEHTGSEGNIMVASGQTTGNTTMVCHLHYHPKRAAPAITLGTALCTNQHNGVAGNVTGKSTSNITDTDCEFRITHAAGTANFAHAQGMSNVVMNNTGDGLKIDAEL